MNYIILYATGFLQKRKMTNLRLIISSTAGAIYAIIAYMNIIPIYSTLFMKILLSIIMIYSVCFPITAFAAALPTVGISSLSVKKNTVTVKWKKKSKIMGYQIQYSTDSKFKKNKKSIKIKKAKITSKKISNLKESKKYYFRIRTYKSSNKKTRYSKWSKVKSIKTPKESKCTKDNMQKENRHYNKTFST